MKKIFTLVCFALATISANAQYNLFDAADCDAEPERQIHPAGLR